MTKAMTIKMAPGKTWRITRVIAAWNCGGTIKQARKVTGWEFTDCEQTSRFVEGTWADLVEAFNRSATNYGYDKQIS